MKKALLFLMPIFLIGSCGSPDNTPLRLFISNHGTDEFDLVLFKVELGGKVIFNDSVKNQYLSFHWTEKDLMVPKEELKLSTTVVVQENTIQRDTMISIGDTDSIQVFIQFDFSPYFKRYTNPDIYKYIEGEIDNYSLVRLADSLYRNDVLLNADEYLNDTIPDVKSLTVTIKD